MKISENIMKFEMSDKDFNNRYKLNLTETTSN